MRTVEFAPGITLPAIAQGTWHLGEDPTRRREEVAALRAGIDLGLTVIDTAEMYADGEAERVVAEAIAGRREEVFLVSKVWPTHARRDLVLRAAEGSLARLGTDHLDLYLLHWPTLRVPLEETLDALVTLVRQGKTRAIGVSNFPAAWFRRAQTLLPLDVPLRVDQVPYSPADRRAERDPLPAVREAGALLMGWGPLKFVNQAASPAARAVLETVAVRHGRSWQQVVLNWVTTHPGVQAIAKAANPAHTRANAAATDFELTPGDLAEIEAAFPLPEHGLELETMD
ncbi:MAG: aldo/keto reductase [Firmicutes bacterium]|nr:aldo/keto reductase [Bacillota bacterium]